MGPVESDRRSSATLWIAADARAHHFTERLAQISAGSIEGVDDFALSRVRPDKRDSGSSGGRIHSSRHWIIEHCVGPLGIGALILKPLRHCLHVADLTTEEAADLGPLLKQASGCTQS